MDKSKRKTIEGWIDKAWNHLQTAKDHLQSYYRYSESIEASQECIELSVESILTLLEIEYSFEHGWNREEFSRIAEQIQARQLLKKLTEQNLYCSSRLPRLLLLANFWAQFHLTAKYGFEAGYLASAKDLFTKQEADLAVQHAEECHQAASELRYLDKDKLAALSGKYNISVTGEGNEKVKAEHFAEPLEHDTSQSLHQQLARHRSNLNKLKEDAAIYPKGAVPLQLQNQIETEQQEIERLEAELAEVEGE